MLVPAALLAGTLKTRRKAGLGPAPTREACCFFPALFRLAVKSKDANSSTEAEVSCLQSMHLI
jgi:hypothetical protein